MLRNISLISHQLLAYSNTSCNTSRVPHVWCAIILRKMHNDSTGHQKDSKKDHLQVTASQQRDAGIHDVCVRKMRDLSPSVKQLDLSTDVRPVPFSFKPGQWVDVFIPGVNKVGGFSMTSSPSELTDKGMFRLAVKYSEHPPALWVHTKCREGDKLAIRVGGDFFLDLQKLPVDKTTHILLIAGGVGINPMASMISAIFDRPSSGMGRIGKIVLFYSAKTAQELIFKEDFDKLSQEDTSFAAHYFLTALKDTKSDPIATGLPQVINRRITKDDFEAALKESQVMPIQESDEVIAYICGPSGMITSAESTLHTLGVKSIYYENWWQSPDE